MEDPEVEEWTRIAGLSAFVTLHAEGRKTREEVIEYLRTLFHGGIEEEPSWVWAFLVETTWDLRATELLREVGEVRKRGLIPKPALDMFKYHGQGHESLWATGRSVGTAFPRQARDKSSAIRPAGKRSQAKPAPTAGDMLLK